MRKQKAEARILLLPTMAAVLMIVGCGKPPETMDIASDVGAVKPPALIEATLAGDGAEVESLLAVGIAPNVTYHTNTALTYAARDGHTEIARSLIAAGAEVNWVDGEGVTPLILSAFKGHVELTELLLANGADPTVVDQWGRTALDYALRRGPDDAIAQLITAAQ